MRPLLILAFACLSAIACLSVVVCLTAIACAAQVPVLRTALVVEGRADSAFGFSVEHLNTSNTVVVRGAFTESLAVEGARHSSRGLSDGFLLCLDDDLRTQWLQTFGGPGYDAITCMAPLPDGGLAVGMICGAGADGITTYRIGDVTFTGRGGADAVVFVVNSDGSVRWVRNDGAINAEYPTSLAVLDDSLIVVAGIFVRRSRFGTEDVTDSAEISGYVQAIDMSGKHRWVRVVRGRGVDGGSVAVEIDPLHVHTTVSGRIDVVVQTTESIAWGDTDLVVSPDVQQRTTVIIHADAAGTTLGIDVVETCVAEQTTFGSTADNLSSASAEYVADACTTLPFDVIAWRSRANKPEVNRIAVPSPHVYQVRDGVRGPLISGGTGAQPLLLSLDTQGNERWRFVHSTLDEGAMYDALETDTSILAVELSGDITLLRLDVPSSVHDNDIDRADRNARIVYYEQLSELFQNGYTLAMITGSAIIESCASSPLHRPLSPQVCVLLHPTEPSGFVLLLP